MPNHKLLLCQAPNYPRAHCLLHSRKRPIILSTLLRGYSRWRSPRASPRYRRCVHPPRSHSTAAPVLLPATQDNNSTVVHCHARRAHRYICYIHFPFFITHNVSTGALGVIVSCLKYQCQATKDAMGCELVRWGRELQVECCRCVR